MATLDQLLGDIENAEKTASAQADPKTGDQAAAQTALKDVLDEAQQSKTASAGGSEDPVDALMKMAEELVESEKEAEVVLAAQCGRAFGDAFLEQIASADAAAKVAAAQYSTGVSDPQISDAQAADMLKQAAATGYERVQRQLAPANDLEEVVKVAAAQGQEEELLKLAAQEGYDAAVAAMQKEAAPTFDTGQQQALQEVHDVCAAEFMKGAQEVAMFANRAEAARQQQQR